MGLKEKISYTLSSVFTDLASEVYASRGPPSLGFGSQVYKILIFEYDFANVGMKRNFTIFLCTCIIKFVLEYAQIARSEPKSMIFRVSS